MPPVVERSGCDHGESTPSGYEGSKRSAKAPYLYACRSSLVRCRALAKGSGKYQETGSKAPQHSTKLDSQMGRGPECIASNRLVPGDVPVPSNHVRGYRHEHAPDRSGYAQSTGGQSCQWDVDGNWLAGVWDSDTAVLRRHGPRGKFCIHGVSSDVG